MERNFIIFRGLIAGFVFCAIAIATGCKGGEVKQVSKDVVRKKLEVYAPVNVAVPWNLLDKNQTAVLEKLYMSAKEIDKIFLRQVSKRNIEVENILKEKGDKYLLRFFNVNFGPWDRLDGDNAFYGKELKPEGAAFYPEDMTREEFKLWLKNHEEDREEFESGYTVISRDKDGGLTAVPYSRYYGDLLKRAAGYLIEAADLTKNRSLAKFLRLRANAFLSDDYYQSNMAWMDVKDSILDVTIGPYEVYEDRLFNYKTAFEAFICVRDPKESKRLEKLKSYLLKMEENLPIEDKYKNFNRGMSSPVSVVDEIFAAGDTKAGVQTLAFNLPNDERVREAKGCKKVMLRNICRAKFEKILLPIAGEVIDKKQLPLVTFEAYFNHILLHEFTHGLGPGRLVLEDGTETTVGKALRERYSAIEEAKADVGGEYNFYYLIREGVFPEKLERETAVSLLAGFFRSVRFGVEESHGRANMIAFNYFRKKGAYLLDQETGLWSVDFEKITEAVKSLLHELLIIQAHGSYESAGSLIEEYGNMGNDVKQSLLKLAKIPVDIIPGYSIEEKFESVEKE
ncbi:peptidase [bacterium]|nr:peptidase [bacterium]